MKELNASSFEEAIKNFTVVVVDFWAPWCGPCRALSPIIEQVASDIGSDESVLIAKVNIDESSELAERFLVQSIPTIIYFKNGNEASRSTGMTTKADIL